MCRSPGRTPSRSSGATLRGLDSPHQASFYTSGRLSNEATFLYQLWVREFGTNNLPDCSNMCHEASGRAMTASLGTGKGTCDLDDWDQADLLIVMGVNAASNAPRMLTSLAEAHRRGAQIVHINPLIEAASRRTIVPHEFPAMATFHATKTGTHERSAPHRRRPGSAARRRQGCTRARRDRPQGDRSRVHAALHDGFRRLPGACRGHGWAGDRAPVRCRRESHPAAGRGVSGCGPDRRRPGVWG